jgi:hypothetical protein
MLAGMPSSHASCRATYLFVVLSAVALALCLAATPAGAALKVGNWKLLEHIQDEQIGGIRVEHANPVAWLIVGCEKGRFHLDFGAASTSNPNVMLKGSGAMVIRIDGSAIPALTVRTDDFGVVRVDLSRDQVAAIANVRRLIEVIAFGVPAARFSVERTLDAVNVLKIGCQGPPVPAVIRPGGQ